MATDIATYLKYANLQMAAEALFGKKTAPSGEIYSGPIATSVLTQGNDRSSKFTATQADEFSKRNRGQRNRGQSKIPIIRII
jgi:hypothetical protein